MSVVGLTLLISSIVVGLNLGGLPVHWEDTHARHTSASASDACCGWGPPSSGFSVGF
jgi:hypothetical protein